MPERVIAATDGSASPNPGPAGWAWVIGDADDRPVRIESGYLGTATNNIGELTAVAELLQATDPGVPLEIRVDSRYAMKAVTEWLPAQRRRGYKTANGEPIKNHDLIVHIDHLLSGRDVRFVHVRAHQVDGDVLNAYADHAAGEAVRLRQGQSWKSDGGADDLPSLPALPSPQERARTPVPRTSAGGRASGTCSAQTKAGKPCQIEARSSGLCHVHDPAVQCQALTSSGRRCTVATGGGRCARHRGAPA